MVQQVSQPVHLSITDGLVKMLRSCEEEKMLHALKRLHDLVDVHSHDMENYLSLVEVISNDFNFKHRDLAKLLLARIYFYNGNHTAALKTALMIPSIFKKSLHTEFSEHLIGEMIDVISTSTRLDSLTNPAENKFGLKDLDESGSTAHVFASDEVSRMTDIIYNVVSDCGLSYDEKQAIGIALELKNINILKRIIQRQTDPKTIIRYMVSVVTRYFSASDFTLKVYCLAMEKLYNQKPIDYSTLIFCLARTRQAEKIAELLIQLAVNEEGNPDSCCIATQLCFDLYENAMPRLIEEILLRIKYCTFYREGKRVTFESSTKKKVKSPSDRPSYTSVVLEPCSDFPPTFDEAELVQSEEFIQLSPDEQELRLDELRTQYKNARLKYIYEKLTKFIIVLRGKATVRLWFEYIIKTMRSDPFILRLLRNSVKSSVSMTAVIFANGIMHCGTTGDSFARENAEWFSKCNNWSKFVFVVNFGIIHSGNHAEGMRVLGSFLPKKSGGNSERKYEESGALCAVGFIYGNRSSKAKEFILHHFYSATNPVIFHGCCLGIGLAWFGCHDAELLKHLWKNIDSDDPIKAFGACLCYGMVNIGLYNETNYPDLRKFLKESKHEKTKIGLSFLMAFVYLQAGHAAWGHISDLIRDDNVACRLAAAYTIGSAYVGSGDINAVRSLWELVVFDVDDDVKRAAIISLAFVLLRDKPQFYDVMTQVFNNHNPMVRCASAFALGIVFAGTGHPVFVTIKDAYGLVSSLFMDMDVRVRQTAYMSAGMIMMHVNEEKVPVSKTVRECLLAVINNSKSIDQLVRYGAIIGIGLIDAGGKNLAVSYFTSDGSIRIYSIVGMLLFSASYYWYPLVGFVTMSLVPAAVIAVKDDFSIPIMRFYANQPHDYFKYAAFAQIPRRTNKNKTSSKLSAHRKSRKSKRVGGDISFEIVQNDNSNFVLTTSKKNAPLSARPTNDPIIDALLKMDESKNKGVKNDKPSRVPPAAVIKITPIQPIETKVILIKEQTPATNVPQAAIISDSNPPTEANQSTASSHPSQQKLTIHTTDWDRTQLASLYESTFPSSYKPTEPFTYLYNPSRVLPCMWNTVKLDESSGYMPFKPVNSGGIVVVKKVGKAPEYLILDPLQVKIVSSKSKTAEQSVDQQPKASENSTEKSLPPSTQ